MLVDDSAYGAPWNNQFYEVEFEQDDIIAKDIMVLNGPKRYTIDELFSAAQGEFPTATILNVTAYEICR